MKSIVIHPLSALLGAAVVGVVLFCASAFQAPTGSSPAQRFLGSLGLTIDGPVQVEGIPRPKQMMRVIEGALFVVPAGKVFVVTGLGSTGSVGGNFLAGIQQDGATVMSAYVHGGGATANPSIVEVPAGLVMPAGSSVGVVDGVSATTILLGYLADA